MKYEMEFTNSQCFQVEAFEFYNLDLFDIIKKLSTNGEFRNSKIELLVEG